MDERRHHRANEGIDGQSKVTMGEQGRGWVNGGGREWDGSDQLANGVRDVFEGLQPP